MGIPVIKPPPRRDGESFEDYQIRCGPWLRATLSAARQSRQSLGHGLVFVVGVLVFCGVVLFVKGCPL